MGISVEKLTVKVGKRKMVLNPRFLKANNAEGNLELIKELFKKKYRLFSRMDRSTKKETLMKLADEVTQNEFEIQKAFNFEPNINFHRFWELPKCECPHMDNQDMWGTGRFIYTENCPIHGKHTWKKND